MKEQIAQHIRDLLIDIASVDLHMVLAVVLIVVTVIVLDAVTAYCKRERKQTGMSSAFTTVSIDGSKTVPVRRYVSDIQGLAGTPDALIAEKGYIIPVERKPLARKIRDRYVAQLLVYMRLVEEFEGKRPPYGYLILGPNCRRFKIDNTEERQAWLQKVLGEMRDILTGAPAVPTPVPSKCRKCDVAHVCSHRAAEPVKIGGR